jgi:glycosyltransferase involved in cell wall biosynthesis
MTKRFAIVTPYYKETRSVLERCMASVRAQTLAADHIMVADGFPQDWIDGTGVRHVRLDRAHGDYGNVARGVGGLLAVAEAYDGIGFLDADNTLEPGHVRLCVEAGAGGADIVAAKRRYVRLDGSEMPIPMEPDHIDTSCYWYQPGGYALIPYWVTIPNELAGIGDRIARWLVQQRGFSVAHVAPVTVNYTCKWRALYLHLNEEPPEGAQNLHDMYPVWAWLLSQPAAKQRVIAKLSGGIDLVPEARRAVTEARYDIKSAPPLPAKPPRYAIVTPYYKESCGQLERCIASVKAQTLAADHFMVADGFPQSWIEGTGVRHIVLDRAHGDYGNVARGEGALLAVAEAYDGIGFLDADNYLDPEHVALCVVAGKGAPLRPDVVVAKRRFVRPDGGDLRLAEEPHHVDTSCWWFQDGAYHLLPYWVTIPKEIAPIGDRVFSGLVDAARLTRAAVDAVTVNYTCLWEGVYRRFGETPPEGAKPDIDLKAVLRWIVALTGDKRRVVAKLSAGDLVPWAEHMLAQLERPK